MFMYSYCYVYSVLYVLFPWCQLAILGYPDRSFSVLFPQLKDKCQGITRKEEVRLALFPISLTTLDSNLRKLSNQSC